MSGNTNRSQHDLDLDLSNTDRDENPGSIISLIRYGDFEYLTTGDATSDDWKENPFWCLSPILMCTNEIGSCSGSKSGNNQLQTPQDMGGLALGWHQIVAGSNPKQQGG